MEVVKLFYLKIRLRFCELKTLLFLVSASWSTISCYFGDKKKAFKTSFAELFF